MHPKQIDSPEALIDVLEYIHANPIKAGYVDIAKDWRYSSARNYMDNDGLMPITQFTG